ncbi:hypothetical protein VdG1_05004 [Verticillium dahliae VDG1]|nr:hypothetical protein VdG1_05004 [Verticillium dahliae VDG1]
MASPMPMQQPSGNWGHYVQQQSMAAPTPNMDDFGSDRRLMGLKVNYTFDREAQVNFLARHPQPLHVNTIALSETKTIGYTDLSLCAQAIAQCSPELLGEDHDYTVYAFDYSEEDTPLVGQGLLSWILHADPSESKMIFGRLTKNPLALLPGGNGLKEMLEVKFKLLPTNRPPRRPDYGRHDVLTSFDQTMSHVKQHDGVMTPTGSQEWDSFLQSNPQLGQHQSLNNPSALPGDQSFDGPNRVAPTLVDTQGDDAANPPSRPASRASTTSTTKRKRTRIPTGRPRGRPPNPKKNAANVDNLHSQGPGSTSGYEEGTDAEESAPAKKKRATTTAVTKNINDPFGGGAGPESLRVAASTAGSIRTLRPPGAGGETTAQGNHLQDVPRAPTPIPAAGPRRAQGGRGAGASSLRRQSTLSQAAIAAEQNPSFTESVSAMSPPSQDGRSPGESEVASPVYSDSPGQIGSSPPVPRVTAYIRSSPPASSPTLPPMPKPQPDSGFMSGDIDDLFDEQSKPFKLEPTSQLASRPIPRASDRQKIPGVLIHELRQTRPASSDVEMAPAPKSPKSPRSNKNLVKKAVIRLRLEEAIAAGQMPAYCTNCGAIETPTWRKIWTQERFGVPEFCEFSEKPGKITAIIVLERDMDDNPSKYQLVKKGLGEKDNKEEWVESLLCNPCGIWLAKWKIHRPPDKWDRGQQPKTRRRGRATRNPKRSKGAAEATSEAAFETDPAGPEGMDVPTEDISKTLQMASVDDTNSREASLALEQALRNDLLSPAKQHRSRHGSTHSRGSGTAKSPIMVGASAEEAIMGATRRLLFPSPRKDGQVKVLNEVAINVTQLDATEVETRDPDSKGPKAPQEHSQLTVPDDDDELEALFRSPMARPSTPPPQDGNYPGPFKTPTRPTPSHRPVTRSISKSIKSGRSRPSPAQALAMLQATPTRTPRSLARVLGCESPSLRRSPRFTGHDDLASALLETPMTRSISQMLSDYGVEDDGLGFGSIAGMPELEGLDDIPFDFGSLLGSDATAASSPSKAKRGTGFDYAGTENMWTEWNKEAPTEPQD